MLLAAYMLFGLLPSSELIFAADPSPLSVSWEPQKQTSDGTGTGVLTAHLDVPSPADPGGTDDPSDPGGTGEETPVAAMVEVTLDPNEAAALTSISDNAQAVLRHNEDGSAVLRLLLSGDTLSFSQELTFTVQDEKDLTIDISDNDIKYCIYTDAASVPADINTAEPITENTGSSSVNVPTEPFVIQKTLPREITITSGLDVNLDSENKDAAYTIRLLDLDSTEASRDYVLSLTLPQGLTLPEGSLSASAITDGSCTITCGSVDLAVLTSLPADATVKDLAATDNGLSFTITLPDGNDAAATEITLAAHCGAFLRSQDAVNDKMSLSVHNAAGGDTMDASVFVTAEAVDPPGTDDQYTLQVSESQPFSQTVAWADNQSPNRPAYGTGSYYPKLSFVIDGVTRPLTEETLQNVGLDHWPEITPTPQGFTINLPTKLEEKNDYATGKTYDVTWHIEPPDVPEGYAFVEVTEENKDQYPSANGTTGWYYMLEGTFSFVLNAKQGGTLLTDEQIKTILNNFNFCWTYGEKNSCQGFDELLNGGNATLQSVTIPDDVGNPTTATQVTIDGLWLYNLDGTPLNFWLTEKAEGEGTPADKKLTSDELDDSLLADPEDWFQVSYKNTHNTSDTTAVYNGGTLLLSGETTFSAEKRWLDMNPSGSLEGRPDVTFTLWRYRAGQSYTSKSQILDVSPAKYTDGGTPQSKDPDAHEGDPASTVYYVPITFTDGEGNPLVLPKYDPDGYAYVYGVQESMEYTAGDNQYETLFGEIGNDDAIVPGTDKLPDCYIGGSTRSNGDSLLYNGGILSNRLKGTVQAPVTKKWESAAYQAAFDDVAVELTLQSRVKGSIAEEDWIAVPGGDGPVTCYLHRFTAERLSESYAVYAPKYNGQAQELEYRWVETGVYQGVTAASDEEVKEQIATANQPGSPVIKIPLSGSGNERTFSLTQEGQEVNYISRMDPATNTIINCIDDTLNYHVIKEWMDGITEKDITFHLYRTASGSSNSDLGAPYVTFSLGADGNLTGTPTGIGVTEDDVSISQDMENDQLQPWRITASNLPRFDENGRPYEYILLEESGYPSYTTERDSDTGDYTTTVFNGGEGTAIPILVRKVWLDDGDDLHREPVTFTVYNANTNQPVLDDGQPVAVTLQDGLWHQVLMVPMDSGPEAENPNGVYNADDLYVVETSMGGIPVDHHLVNADGDPDLTKLDLYGDGTEGNPGGLGDDDKIFDVTTDDHRYQVTYRYEDGSATGGIDGTFTVTNRRLGYIDLTANKTWLNGGSGEAYQAIQEALQEIKTKENKNLALVFKLKFANQKSDWVITTDGLKDGSGDTVSVGENGIRTENLPIYSVYDEETGQYGLPVSSLQPLLKLDDNGTLIYNTELHFFGLPKYDSQGQVVEYTIEELWVDTANPDTPIDLSQYPQLEAIWKEYSTTYDPPIYTSLPDEHNTKDIQTNVVTNKRSSTKDVVWYKVWKDDYAASNDHRPDLFLDIYRVVHVSDGQGGYKKQIQPVQNNVQWTQLENTQVQQITLSGMQKYDDYGFEILYYAVERTVVSVGDYDYQAAQYSHYLDDGTSSSLGTRDEPIDGAVENGYVLDLRDENLWNDNRVPSDLDASIGSFEDGGTAQYALMEKGVFTNALADNYTIDGMKYWSSLPSGWPQANLPSITFDVSRYTDDMQPDHWEKHVAWVTIPSDLWASLKDGLSYRYLIQYEGENTLSTETVNGKTVLKCSGKENASLLPRYDSNGKLYTYVVEETIHLEDGTNPSEVFTSSSNAFTFTNEYRPVTGYIAAKKFLYLPTTTDASGNTVPETYPAVTFQLTRQVYKDGKYQKDDAFGTKKKVLSSAEVQRLYDSLAEGSDGKQNHYVTGYVVFENLPLYAPDGHAYQYTITENKSELMGYDTWVQTGDAEIGSFSGAPSDQANPSLGELTPKKGSKPLDLTGEASVTFKNQPSTPSEEFTGFTGTKVWEDFEDSFGFRPTKEYYQTLLTLKRTAKTQTGQGNAMEETLTFQLTYTSTDEKTWKFEIRPVDGASFEMYAPNGMPWTYTLSEPLTKSGGKLQLETPVEGQPQPDANRVYTPTPSDGIWPVDVTYKTKPGADDLVSFGTLTNSIQTNAQFKKVWMDSNNQSIPQDYLGIDVTVTFQLQVSTDNGAKWTAATENALVMQAMEPDFTGIQTLSGRINDTSKWSGSFKKLPSVIKDNTSGNYTFLKYRVIETNVSYGSQNQNINLPADGSNGTDFGYTLGSAGLVTGSTFKQTGTTSTSTNILDTMEVSVEKVWQDGGNPYNTRPGVSHPMTWTSWFVVQRTTDAPTDENAQWNNVAIVKLYGGNTKGAINGDRWQDTVTGLPTADYSSGSALPYTYRVRELQPKTGGYTTVQDIQPSDIVVDTYNPDGTAYTTSYAESPANHWTVTNTLTTSAEMTAIRAKKVWAGTAATRPSVSFQLQYRTSDSAPWEPVTGETHTKEANDSNSWEVIWNDLPKTIGEQEVQYQVVELTGSGFVLVAQDIDTTTPIYTYTFTNSLTREFTVEKLWNPGSSAAGSATVGLYRTTDLSAIGLTTGERVPENELSTSGPYQSATLTATGNWVHTFTGLPQYSAAGQLYYYYALELDSSGNPVGSGNTVTLSGSTYVVTYNTLPDNTKTTVTNTPAMDMTGTKTWKDNGAATRPDVTLILERRITGSDWDPVMGAAPTWQKPAGDTWTYTYTGLPTHDANGIPYEYRVREYPFPNGYILLNQEQGQLNGVVKADAQGKYNFVNVRSGLINLTVTKTWTGDLETDRPTSLELKLERKTVNQADDQWSVVSVTTPAPTVSGNVWTYVYSDLPQFDSDGVAYEYRVTEVTTGDILSKYEVKNSTNTDPTVTYQLENIRLGSLIIRKEVSGNIGETDRDFHFTVSLSGSSLANTPAENVDGSYQAVYTKQDGSTETKSISFVDGISEEFTLKHKESLAISGLPAGLTYNVTETEANKEGYSTTSTGNGLTIPAGASAEAAFENYRHAGTPQERITITGTKTWVDNSNAAGMRPDSLELTLYRSISGGKEVVVNAVPTWSKNGDVWTYTYSGLLKQDSSGKPYIYRVEETVPDGYAGQTSGFHFTNTLITESIALSGQKFWVGDDPADRPESITVVLLANGEEVRRLTVTAADNWQYRFENLPKTDAQGKEISYSVQEETVPEGYQVRYDGLNIINQKDHTDKPLGDLRISKQVTGEGADPDQLFSFTVTLSDTSINGVYGELTFVNGVASFTLHHGQSVIAVGLPAGTSYTVTEDVPDGFTSSATGQTGLIVQDAVTEAAFINTVVPPVIPPVTPPETPPETPDDSSTPNDTNTPEDSGGRVVKTGDESHMTLYAFLTVFFAAGLAATLVSGKKGKKKRG